MSVRCKHVQEALAAGAIELGTDALLQKHLNDCVDCSALLGALEMVDESLATLPSINPPLDLVDRVLVKAGTRPVALQLVHSQPGKAEVEEEVTPERARATRMGRALAMGSAFAAAAAVALVSVSSFSSRDNNRDNVSTPTSSVAAATPVDQPVADNGIAIATTVDGNIGNVPRDVDKTKESTTFGMAGYTAKPRESLGLKQGGKMNGGDDLVLGEKLALLESETTRGGRFQDDHRGPSNDEDGDGRDKSGVQAGQVTYKRNGKDGQGLDGFRQGQVNEPARPEKSPEPLEAAKHQVVIRTPPPDALVKADESVRVESLRRDAVDVPNADPEPGDAIKTTAKSGKVDAQKARVSERKLVDGRKGRKGKKGETEGREGKEEKDRWIALQPVDQPRFYRFQEVDEKERDSSGLVTDKTNKANKAKDGEKSRDFKSRVTVSGTRHADGLEGLNGTGKRENAQQGLTVDLTEQTAEQSSKQSSLARAFVAERSKHAAVPTVSANGFWSNNYIPGDPRLRLLAARLLRDPNAGSIGSLDATIAPNPQSFDAPKNSALAVSVRSDRRASDGPARMLLQVGLKGTARQAGGRPALNIGVVLDLAGATGEAEAAQMRALVSALRVAKRRGDKFSLTVANRPGGLMVTPKQFRNGPVRVAMQGLFAENSDRSATSSKTSTQVTLSLAEAVGVATAQVAATDDSKGPLGRSLVLVVTASTTASDIDRELEELAHINATNGIGLSTIGVGTAVDDGQLLRWAAAGHGNRRLLVRQGDAKKVIGSELASAESVVARAVRVRVKLASGVKLVEVVGAHRLDAAAAARTREAEKSIDRRVAKARGIVSDREQDEDGVKIIIPSFSAGDSHVILLDVIAEKPGVLADVAVTYKDLVHLRNGSTKSSLSLKRGRNTVGHLERSVFQNYVGLIISQRLSEAGALLSKSNGASAAQVLEELANLLAGLRSELSWLRKDAGFERDAKAVAKFRDVLKNGVSDVAKAYVANSLSYAAWRKIVRVRRETN